MTTRATYRPRLLDELVEFAGSRYGSLSRKAHDMYPPLSAFENDRGEPFPVDAEQLREWLFRMGCGLVFDTPVPAKDETIAQAFLRRKGHGLAEEERGWLEQMVKAPVIPYEVLEVQRDSGMKLRNLWTGAEVFVSERLATHDLAIWHILAGRLSRERGLWVLEGGAYLFPPEYKAEVELAMAQFRSEIAAAPGGESKPEEHMGFSVRAHEVWNNYIMDVMEELGDQDAPEDKDIPPGAGFVFTRAHLRESMEPTCREWIDEPHPSLDRETPRQAVRTSSGRSAVSTLLRVMENFQELKGPQAGGRYDFPWMWKELRLLRG